jgi:hypothetical protein
MGLLHADQHSHIHDTLTNLGAPTRTLIILSGDLPELRTPHTTNIIQSVTWEDGPSYTELIRTLHLTPNQKTHSDNYLTHKLFNHQLLLSRHINLAIFAASLHLLGVTQAPLPFGEFITHKRYALHHTAQNNIPPALYHLWKDIYPNPAHTQGRLVDEHQHIQHYTTSYPIINSLWQAIQN